MFPHLVKVKWLSHDPSHAPKSPNHVSQCKVNDWHNTASPSLPNMTTATFCSQIPDTISIAGDTLYPNPGKMCIVCDPPHKHLCTWTPNPDSYEWKGRTLVLCYQCRATHGDVDERQLQEAGCVLSGDFLSRMAEFSHSCTLFSLRLVLTRTT